MSAVFRSTQDSPDERRRRRIAALGLVGLSAFLAVQAMMVRTYGRTQKRLIDLRYGLTGRIPDGMLFRISSIDPNPAQAYRQQDVFVAQLLAAVSPAERKRLSGLGDPR